MKEDCQLCGIAFESDVPSDICEDCMDEEEELIEDDGPMIDWCEHGKVLVCEECAKRHRSTEQPSEAVADQGVSNLEPL